MTDLPDIALSVRQPWAHGIIWLGKDIENRIWRRPNPGLDFRGRVAIHAARGMTQDEYEEARAFMSMWSVTCPPAHELARGGIIGSVEITDVVAKSESIWFTGPRGLVLRDPVPCAFIPAAGQLGFFKWRPDPHLAPPEMARWMLPVTPPDAPVTTPDLFVRST